MPSLCLNTGAVPIRSAEVTKQSSAHRLSDQRKVVAARSGMTSRVKMAETTTAWFRTMAVFVGSLNALAISPAEAQQRNSAAISPPAAAAPPDDGQWTMPAKNYASTRYSELSEINEGNIGKLQVAFTFSTGVNKGHEAAPLVVGNTMYIVTPYPNILCARSD